MKFEHKGEKLLPFHLFLGRVGISVALALAISAVALAIGTLGYHGFAGLGWVDAELNAAMILTGMGPVNPMQTTGSKLFASVYALFSGVVFLSSMGIVLSPVIHRIVHRFHMADDDTAPKSAGRGPRETAGGHTKVAGPRRKGG